MYLRKWIILLLLLLGIVFPQGLLHAEEVVEHKTETTTAPTAEKATITPELLKEAAIELNTTPEALAQSVATDEEIFQMLRAKKIPQQNGVPTHSVIRAQEADNSTKEQGSKPAKTEGTTAAPTANTQQMRATGNPFALNNYFGWTALSVISMPPQMAMVANAATVTDTTPAAQEQATTATQPTEKAKQETTKTDAPTTPWLLILVCFSVVLVGVFGMKKNKGK